MKFELKDMYNYLISHTFPGAILGVEILLALQWFFNFDVLSLTKKIFSYSAGGILFFIIGTYAVSTLLGLIIDAIHHFCYEDFPIPQKLNKLMHINKPEAPKYNRFDGIVDDMSMEAYKHFISEEYYYPYEAFANISVVMFFGIYLLEFWLLCILNYKWKSCNFLLPLILYLAIVVIMICEARVTWDQMTHKEEPDFVKAFSNRKPQNSEGKLNHNLSQE